MRFACHIWIQLLKEQFRADMRCGRNIGRSRTRPKVDRYRTSILQKSLVALRPHTLVKRVVVLCTTNRCRKCTYPLHSVWYIGYI
ncbi:Protein of unknown function [Pyronema omphalodes CBS 100304]|uniref:Uncharacterized protein n=1 Tax=Pyronema omphalodes (strain CBS 100304) TaxID=1076935 RepID=U4L1U5_PYROM|nr:Protein of unknown function [Pyronema omphalodes CBS 100304]